MFLLEGINVDDIYNSYNRGCFPEKLAKNIPKKNPTFVYKKTIQKYVITGRIIKSDDKFMCYLCNNKFEYAPYGIPISSKTVDNKIYMDVEGCYCSNECAFCMLKFLITQDPVKYKCSVGWLKTLHFLENPDSPALKTAPITLLKRFGGFLDDSEFVDYLKNKTHRLQMTKIDVRNVGDQYQVMQ